MEGKLDFCKGIKVANVRRRRSRTTRHLFALFQLALKHRQGKNHRPRIVAFVGSPLEVDGSELTKLAKRLKKEKVSIDIVVFGEEVKVLVSSSRFASIAVLVVPGKIGRIYQHYQRQREREVNCEWKSSALD